MRPEWLDNIPVWQEFIVALAALGAFSGGWKAVQWWLEWRRAGHKDKREESHWRERIEAQQKDIVALRAALTESQGMAQSALMQAAHTQVIGEESPIAMWAKDTRGVRIWQNRAYESLTGYSAAQCIGRTDLEITGNSLVADDWAKHDRQVLSLGHSVETIELCSHCDAPDQTFLVLSYKWPTRLGPVISGVQGAAIKLESVERAQEAHAALIAEVKAAQRRATQR